MKEKILVKHTHRYTKEEMVLFHGNAQYIEYEKYYEYIYYDEQKIKTVLRIYEDKMEIQRYGEAISSLLLVKNEMTKNPITSPYGTFEIDIYTHDYKYGRNWIKVEYDVENGTEEKDGFIVEIRLEERKDELN